MNIDRIKAESKGRWISILEAFNINVGIGKHQQCPVCGGKDRFRFDNKDGEGTWFCNGCDPQAGDGFRLVENFFGIDFVEAAKKVGAVIGVSNNDPEKPSVPMVDPKIALTQLWTASTPFSPNDPVGRYLRSRKINLAPQNVRYCKECYESETKKRYPTMIARIHNKDGKPISLHRTYLADVPTKRKMMPPTEPLAGGAIRLNMPTDPMFEDETLGVAEGIETSLSVSQLFQISCWATLSTSGMVAFEPPEGIRIITVFGDNDSNFAGQKAAYTLANKLFIRGLVVQVMFTEHGDFNDALTKEVKEEE